MAKSVAGKPVMAVSVAAAVGAADGLAASRDSVAGRNYPGLGWSDGSWGWTPGVQLGFIATGMIARHTGHADVGNPLTIMGYGFAARAMVLRAMQGGKPLTQG